MDDRLSLNGDGYRLKSHRSPRSPADGAERYQATADPYDPATGEILPA